jgi:hypothetical protein
LLVVLGLLTFDLLAVEGRAGVHLYFLHKLEKVLPKLCNRGKVWRVVDDVGVVVVLVSVHSSPAWIGITTKSGEVLGPLSVEVVLLFERSTLIVTGFSGGKDVNDV